MALTVLGRVTSINVRKVLWAADEIGLDYRREDWGAPLRDPRVPEFLRLNPNGQVPVIVDGDFVLWESNAIMRYLAQREGSDLLPREPRQQAVVEQWLGWQATDLNAQWGYALNALLRRVPGHDDKARIAASVSGWNAKMAVLEERLAAGNAFVGGDRFSLADIAIALSVHRWAATPMQRPHLPEVEDYYRRMRARPAGRPYLGAATP